MLNIFQADSHGPVPSLLSSQHRKLGQPQKTGWARKMRNHHKSMLKTKMSQTIVHICFVQDRVSPIQTYNNPSATLDWSSTGSQLSPSSPNVGRASHYYNTSSLPSHATASAGTFSPYTMWDNPPQASYNPYNLPSHGKTQRHSTKQHEMISKMKH